MKRSNQGEEGANAPSMFKLSYSDQLGVELDPDEFRRICDVVAEDRVLPNLGATDAPKFRPAGFRGYLEIIDERE